MCRGNDAEDFILHHPLSIIRFPLVSLNIHAILEKSTIYRRRERFGRVTDRLGLGEVYGGTIERIRAQSGDRSRLGMEALMWVSHAERPLRADELCHALAVELGSTEFNADNIPSISTLVGCCQGLITVDKESSIVRLVHFMLQKYLSVNPDIFSTPHSAMAEICLTYLNSEQVKAIPTDPSPNLHHTPFLEYCSLYWGVHAKEELSQCAKSLALELFRGYDGHISAQLLSRQVDHLYLEDSGRASPLSGLHCASFFGIAELVAAFIEMECYDINGGYFGGYTPLSWAARNGHQQVVEILLERGEISPDKPNDNGETPFWGAAENGHQGVVKMLLRREEVNLDKADNYGRTPLWPAAWGGHEGVVKILLGREVNPDRQDKDGRTPLSCSAENGHEEVVKMLLACEGVNPDKSDNFGRTPLLHAAWDGREGVVKILLQRGEVRPDKQCDTGQTPLSYAAQRGHEEVVKILLGGEEINPTGRMAVAKHHSRMLLSMDMREWRKYYSGGKKPTSTDQQT